MSRVLSIPAGKPQAARHCEELTMSPSVSFQRIALQNLLSFGSPGIDLALNPLNIIIGTNATGKSNLIEAFSILHSAPTDIQKPIVEGGDTSEWLWKGEKKKGDARIKLEVSWFGQLISHSLSFNFDWQSRFKLTDETISLRSDKDPYGNSPWIDVYQFNKGKPIYKGKAIEWTSQLTNASTPITRDPLSQSFLSLKSGSPSDPELFALSFAYTSVGLYRDWSVGPNFPPCQPQAAYLQNKVLQSDASNLALVLHDLDVHHSSVMETISGHLRAIFPLFSRVTPEFYQGKATIFVHERGLRAPVPAIRSSDGLMRFLCLLVVLCHPSPPLIVCIEEPEIGLHPDAIVELAKVLKDAATRTQVIVTTHSDILVSQFTDTPESVVVCERDENGTHMKRLERDKLESWLKDEYLGDLWLSGGIGGTL